MALLHASGIHTMLPSILAAASMAHLQASSEGGVDIRGGLKGQLSEGGVSVMHILVQGSSPLPASHPPEGSGGQALQGARTTL